MKKMMILSAGLSLLLTVPAFAQGGHGGIKQLDANNDGQITLQEAQAAAEKHFNAADTNHDGQITQAERDQKMAAWQAKKGQQAQNKPQKQNKAQHKGQGKGMKGPDANGDGIVTRAEAMAAAQQHFQRMDSDKNGVVSATELQQLMQKRQSRRSNKTS